MPLTKVHSLFQKAAAVGAKVHEFGNQFYMDSQRLQLSTWKNTYRKLQAIDSKKFGAVQAISA